MTEQPPAVDQGHQVPAGWYPDPRMPGTQRYWDGARWTEHVAPAGVTRSPVDYQRSTSTLETLGWLGALFLPIAGVVIGIILADRPGMGRRAGAMIALSIVVGVAAYVAWSNSVATY